MATLVIAKLDRLSRRAAFAFRMLDAADVPFVICDLPCATRLTIGLYAVVAEDESAKVSARTKAALAARAARGLEWGAAATVQQSPTVEDAKRAVAELALQRGAHLRPPRMNTCCRSQNVFEQRQELSGDSGCIERGRPHDEARQGVDRCSSPSPFGVTPQGGDRGTTFGVPVA